ncbi:aldehyde dehydrogenase [Penicillium riverlandense]|uniref:aldehyde dehydrogenase n=1 Tax=Penicillium riverlandense TaxID=1903569 RepID=UPI0025465FDD|nr:aldehyde dehydrogenase [Penicillium riverlandense]KAJ5812196.1 aldehyde dehydrogenase [Penicillium riverlandense]
MAITITKVTTHALGDAEALNFTTFKNIVGGKLVDTKEHRRGMNPATLAQLPDVPIATEQDLDNAVESATAAFKTWSCTPYVERRAALLRFADAFEAKAKEFVQMLTVEQGKPIFQAEIEVSTAVQWIRSTAELGDVGKDEVIEDNSDRKVIVRHTPLGVVAAIVPWNFPILLEIAKLAPALLTGNTLIIKPSPFTPYSGLKIAELAQSFFPPGVVQALSGNDSLGPWIVAHPGVQKISFTGSTATGKLVAASAGRTLKRVTLELGGNDAAIVCKDVDIQTTAAKVATFAFLNAGQICMAIKRVYIHESIYDEFLDAMTAYVKTLAVGNGLDDGVFCGPVQNKLQYERVQEFLTDARKKDQKIAVGEQTCSRLGYFVNPTIIDNPGDDSKIVLEEPFGPILPIMPWSSEDEVIIRANDTNMGLAASVWSRDLEQAERLARQIDAGTVWINKHFDPLPNAPFGGHKDSGIGVEFGIAGLQGMCNSQTIVFNKV